MRAILQLKLKILAKLIIRKYRPEVVGITGSIGKTSTKEAIASVLGEKMAIRAGIKNYNNEIGLPLVIIGASSPGSSLSGWLQVFWRAWRLILFRDASYPKVLILEMGIDRPGDMRYLTSIVKPTIGVATAVSYAHLEFFGTVDNIKKEKQVLIEELDNKGLAVLNYDNQYTREMSEASKARILTYGLQAGADLRAQDIVYNYTKGDYELSGINFKMNYQGSIVPVSMKNAMSEAAIYAALAAAAVGIYFELNLIEVAKILSNLSLPPGRLSLLPGINHTFIIDDTYNSSPEAALLAVDVLGRVKIDKSARKYAVLGDMREIGSYTEEGHRDLGAAVKRAGVDCLVAVGSQAELIAAGAREAGFLDEEIFCFGDSLSAGEFLKARIASGDVVLLKGSQAVRLEKAVKMIMLEPERANELLARQGEEWRDR